MTFYTNPNAIILIASVWTGIAVLLAVLVFLHKWLQVPRGWRVEELNPPLGVLTYPGQLNDAQLAMIREEWAISKVHPSASQLEYPDPAASFPVQLSTTDEILPGYWGFIGTNAEAVHEKLEPAQRFPEAPTAAPLVEAAPNLDKDQTPVPVAVKRSRAKRPRKAKGAA